MVGAWEGSARVVKKDVMWVVQTPAQPTLPPTVLKFSSIWCDKSLLKYYILWYIAFVVSLFCQTMTNNDC
jgi:hypothetical protein